VYFSIKKGFGSYQEMCKVTLTEDHVFENIFILGYVHSSDYE